MPELYVRSYKWGRWEDEIGVGNRQQCSIDESSYSEMTDATTIM